MTSANTIKTNPSRAAELISVFHDGREFWKSECRKKLYPFNYAFSQASVYDRRIRRIRLGWDFSCLDLNPEAAIYWHGKNQVKLGSEPTTDRTAEPEETPKTKKEPPPVKLTDKPMKLPI